MGELKNTMAASFPTTRWSLVLAAGEGEGDDDTNSLRALEELCGIYWRPVYSFVRARGKSREDAEDLTQGFIASLLKRGSFSEADRERGKMRSFLRVALKRFVINQDEKSHAQKRGGFSVPLAIDVDEMEARLRDSKAVDPERAFEQQWALALLAEVLRRLESEYESSGRVELFIGLRETLSLNGEEIDRAVLAEQMQMTEGALRVAVFRLRRRYRELLRSAIAETVLVEADIDEEIEYLMRLFGSGEPNP